MPLKFDLSGPVFEEDGTELEFKRVSQSQVLSWEIKNSVLKDRTPEEKKEFADRAKKKISNWDYYSDSEKANLFNLTSIFCLDHLVSIKNLLDENGTEIDFDSLPESTKMRFFDDLVESSDTFSEWLSKYKAGSEKKS